MLMQFTEFLLSFACVDTDTQTSLTAAVGFFVIPTFKCRAKEQWDLSVICCQVSSQSASGPWGKKKQLAAKKTQKDPLILSSIMII